MASARLDVRLDRERRQKLDEIAASRRVPVSAVIRAMIDETYEAVHRADRLRVVQELAGLHVEDVPDPETLSRQLESTYAIPDLP